MDQSRLRRLAAISLILGGSAFLTWSGVGGVVATDPGWLSDGVLLVSYGVITVGFGSLSWVARRTDDPTSTGVTPLAIGLVLLVPLAAGVTVGGSVAPHTELFLLATVAGVVAVLFGFGVLAGVLYFTDESAVIAQPWGRVAAALSVGGLLGWVVGMAFGQPDPPQAFRIVTPYTAPLDAPTLGIVVASFGALGLALCLLGGGVLRDSLRTPTGRRIEFP